MTRLGVLVVRVFSWHRMVGWQAEGGGHGVAVGSFVVATMTSLGTPPGFVEAAIMRGTPPRMTRLGATCF